MKDPLDHIFSQAGTAAIDPLDDIFSQAETTVISTIGASVEKPLDLGALANIHIKGKAPPSSCKIGSIEFMFLQGNTWYKYNSGPGKILPVSDDELKKYSDPSKYMLLDPSDQDEESKKSGVYDFLLYELASKSFHW